MNLQNDRAVSPVVGIMLILVVAVLLAAVTSGVAGDLISGLTRPPPRLTMDVTIKNSGYWSSSYFKAEVTGADEPIQTRDLKLVTAWTKDLQNGTTIHGGATVIPGVLNFKVLYNSMSMGNRFYDTWQNVVPQGYGPGVKPNGSGEFITFAPVEGGPRSMAEFWAGKGTNYTWFGNYVLQPGTIMHARPFGGKRRIGQVLGQISFEVGYGITANASDGITGGGRYNYAYGHDPNPAEMATFLPYPESIDQMQAVLGNNWNLLRPGDIVTMNVIHIPSGTIVWQKDITVTE